MYGELRDDQRAGESMVFWGDSEGMVICEDSEKCRQDKENMVKIWWLDCDDGGMVIFIRLEGDGEENERVISTYSDYIVTGMGR